MKRFFVILVLVASTAQIFSVPVDSEKELKDTRSTVSSRTISAGKALVAGFLAYWTAKWAIDSGCVVYGVSQNDSDWFFEKKDPDGFHNRDFRYGVESTTKTNRFAESLAMAGIYSCATALLLKRLWHDANHAINNE